MTLPPIPLQTDMAVPTPLSMTLVKASKSLPSKISIVWSTWLRALVLAVDSSSQVQGRSPLTAQVAAIPATAIATQSLSAGLYRLSWYARITTPASISSILTLTFSWVDGGVACSFSGSAINGNLTTSLQSGTIFIRVDPGTLVNYAASYTSVGTAMAYALDVILELVP